MSKPKIIVITTAYNVKQWINKCLGMTQDQTYSNFVCAIGDDNSNDGTSDIIKSFVQSDPRFIHAITDRPGMGQGAAYIAALNATKVCYKYDSEAIIAEVDGDDWLADIEALEKIAHVYHNNPNIWMTFGQYRTYPTYNFGGHIHYDIHTHIDEHNLYRSNPFPYSHLKTYKAWLVDKVNPEDLQDPKTGEIFNAAWDHVLCMPMVEMAGRHHIYRVPDVTYILNRHDELQNEGRHRSERQKEVSEYIRTKPAYSKL